MSRGLGERQRLLLAASAPARALQVTLLLAGLAACGRQDDASLAARGEVDPDAPVRTSLSIAIKAPAALVWTVLSGIDQWPSWQPDIQKTSVVGPPETGVAFRWTTPGGTIRSRIELFEPGRRLSWIGHIMVFHAIHVWTLESLPNGNTKLSTSETLSGWPITLFYTSDDLRQADQRWLDALRREVERRTTSNLPHPQ